MIGLFRASPQVPLAPSDPTDPERPPAASDPL